MSELIRGLQDQVRQGAKKLTIRETDVRPLAEYFRDLSQKPIKTETVERGILEGNLRLWGVPVEVEND